MATMIPSNINEIATIGEKRVFKVLESLLPDDYCVWYDVRINERYPDFIILGPDLGILVLEVKDWQLESILNADIENFYLSTSGVHKNPLKQARDYMNILVNELKQDKNLIQSEGKYKGNLSFTYGHGVIFTNIDKNSFKSRFNQVISDQFIIYGDDLQTIEDNLDKKALMDKLKVMFIRRFNFKPLNNIAMRSIKNCIGQTISESELKLVDLEMKIQNIQSEPKIKQDFANEDINIKTMSKGKRKKTLITPIILLFIVVGGLLFFNGSGIVPRDVEKQRIEAISKENIGKKITMSGKISNIKIHKNGHLIITLNGYEGDVEVFINAREKESFPNFSIGNNYEFIGILKEYNHSLQLHPNLAEEVVNE